MREVSRRFEPNKASPQYRQERRERSASDKDTLKANILDILDSLMARADNDDDDDDAVDDEDQEDDVDAFVVVKKENGEDLPREDRQFITRSLPLEKCEVTGHEIRLREECEEVFEIECNNVTVTKNRTEIINRCMNRIDEKCRVTMIEVPKQKCRPKQEQRYEMLSFLIPRAIY